MHTIYLYMFNDTMLGGHFIVMFCASDNLVLYDVMNSKLYALQLHMQLAIFMYACMGTNYKV